MEANYVHKDSTILVQDELVKNELNQIELQYNTLKQQKFNELLKENQELKKQLEDKTEDYKRMKDNFDSKVDVLTKIATQQKEFISYLENEIDICDSFLDTVKSDSQEIPYGVISAGKTYITTRIKENETAHKVYKEVLKKYRSIIECDKVE